MPPITDLEKCDGCQGEGEPLCEQVCPGDLMRLGEDKKGFCIMARDCWDCMSCIKACPKGALETRIPYQIGYRDAKLIPMMGTDNITWTCVDLNGKTDRYQFTNRNTDGGAGMDDEW